MSKHVDSCGHLNIQSTALNSQFGEALQPQWSVVFCESVTAGEHCTTQSKGRLWNRVGEGRGGEGRGGDHRRRSHRTATSPSPYHSHYRHSHSHRHHHLIRYCTHLHNRCNTMPRYPLPPSSPPLVSIIVTPQSPVLEANLPECPSVPAMFSVTPSQSPATVIKLPDPTVLLPTRLSG